VSIDSRISRRQALGRLGAASALLGTRCAKGPQRPRPNFLIVMTDDQQHDEMSCAGRQILETPNLDRVAADGVRFESAFCTNSLCAPSRATILTGCFSHVHGIRGNSERADAVEELDLSLATFPQMLREAGYRTGLMGKWHVRQDPRGFDEWRVLPGQGVYEDPEYIHQGDRRQERGYATDITADFALDFLRKHDSSRPFCLLFQTKAPHRPFTPAPRHATMFEDVEWPYPETYNDDYSTRKVAAQAEDMRFEVSLAGDYEDLPKKLSPDEQRNWIYQRFVKDHHRAVYGVDENLGRVLDYLDQRGFAEDTVVLFTTDNGYFLGEHGWYDKRFMYEPSLRIPLLMRYPRLGRAGIVESAPVMNVDIAPTIVELAGLTPPESMQGRSLVPLLEGERPDDWREEVYYSYFENSWVNREMSREQMTDPSFEFWTAHRVGPHRGVRTDRFKLIEYYSEGDYWELFDLEKDPHELRNIYGDPEHSDVSTQLTAKLRSLREDFGEIV